MQHKAQRITREEAWEAVQDGADNVMCREYFHDLCCDDEACECSPENPCWVGIQKGDEDDDGKWPERWQTFELWYSEGEYQVIIRAGCEGTKLAEIIEEAIEKVGGSCIQVDELFLEDKETGRYRQEIVWQS